MTSKPLGSPIYFYSVVVVVSHVSMHAQNCIPETSVSYLIYPDCIWDKGCVWDNQHIARYWLMLLILVFTNAQQKIIYRGKNIWNTIWDFPNKQIGKGCVYYSTHM